MIVTISSVSGRSRGRVRTGYCVYCKWDSEKGGDPDAHMGDGGHLNPNGRLSLRAFTFPLHTVPISGIL